MLIVGKMSVAIRAIVTIPSSTTRMAITVKVYGRLRAKRTIHISANQSFRADKVCVEQSRHVLLPVSLWRRCSRRCIVRPAQGVSIRHTDREFRLLGSLSKSVAFLPLLQSAASLLLCFIPLTLQNSILMADAANKYPENAPGKF